MMDRGLKMILRFLIVALVCAAALFGQGRSDWHRPFPAFRIAGNLYYVGTADLAAYLIHTPEGNILINSDYPEDVPLIKKSIASLGFKYSDTKILLISHAHADHDGGIGLIKKQTGAQLMVMDADVAEVESTAKERPGAHVDRVLHDGDTVELGGAKWIARLTPGHTKGCTTWTSVVREGNRNLNVVIVGSPYVNSGTHLVNNKSYPGIAEDYVKTFAVLKSLPCDVFLGAHGVYFRLKEKSAQKGGVERFIDPEGYKKHVAMAEAEFREEWERQKKHPDSPKQ